MKGFKFLNDMNLRIRLEFEWGMCYAINKSKRHDIGGNLLDFHLIKKSLTVSKPF